MVSVNDKESIAEINKLVSGHAVTDVGNTRHKVRERDEEIKKALEKRTRATHFVALDVFCVS